MTTDGTMKSLIGSSPPIPSPLLFSLEDNRTYPMLDGCRGALPPYRAGYPKDDGLHHHCVDDEADHQRLRFRTKTMNIRSAIAACVCSAISVAGCTETPVSPSVWTPDSVREQ